MAVLNGGSLHIYRFKNLLLMCETRLERFHVFRACEQRDGGHFGKKVSQWNVQCAVETISHQTNGWNLGSPINCMRMKTLKIDLRWWKLLNEIDIGTNRSELIEENQWKIGRLPKPRVSRGELNAKNIQFSPHKIHEKFISNIFWFFFVVFIRMRTFSIFCVHLRLKRPSTATLNLNTFTRFVKWREKCRQFFFSIKSASKTSGKPLNAFLQWKFGIFVHYSSSFFLAKWN